MENDTPTSTLAVLNRHRIIGSGVTAGIALSSILASAVLYYYNSMTASLILLVVGISTIRLSSILLKKTMNGGE